MEYVSLLLPSLIIRIGRVAAQHARRRCSADDLLLMNDDDDDDLLI
jgi:hypothetical protein